LHRQPFVLPGDVSAHYDVVACERCGFMYADEIPSQRDHDAYYESSGKHVHDTGVPQGLREIHRNFHGFIREHAALDPARDAVLDIGSSMGHFLQLFKADGFAALQGIEPSNMARKLARETYAIDVAACTIERFVPEQSFALATICGVLEHIVELRAALEHVRRCVRDGGFLFVAVPDAGAFASKPPREPFLEFALEHVDFFTRRSLDNLLGQAGFAPHACVSQHNAHYDNHYLLALYRRQAGPDCWVADQDGPEQMRRYIALCEQKLQAVRAAIDALVATREPVAVWGVGSLTSRLLASTQLGAANIVQFVDRNPALHGTCVRGVPISPPDALRGKQVAVLVASYVFGKEIERTLRDDFRHQGRIVLL
jgi:SAM-dependent methyltransferase